MDIETNWSNNLIIRKNLGVCKNLIIISETQMKHNLLSIIF
jgi:hypothetical protein